MIEPSPLDFLLVFLAALATVLVTTPLAGRLAYRLGAVDQPGERRVHERPTPRLGGLAIFMGLLAAIVVGARLPGFERVFTHTSEPEAILLASLAVVVLGVLDDVRGVSAPAKLAGQILSAGVLVLFGVTLLFVYIPGNPGSVVSLSTDLGAIVTVLAVVAMINTVNLVDGLDGLAAGIVLIAATALLSYVQFSDPTALGLPSAASLVLTAVIGATLGFLVFNFHPASIFMGDTGAMLLGLLLASAGVSAIGGTVQPSRGAFAAFSVPVLVPVLVLAVPFLDTAWAILRRLRAGQPVFSPDKRHLHHRLIEIGHSHRRAVLIMYYWSALLAFATVGVGLLPLRVVAAVVGAGALLAVAVAVLPRLAGRGSSGSGTPSVR
ncbi:MAG TPA: MraY family glycosyltransferase [Egibacteraceae bacterium]|nr:MraY family glycosyltransferase [Egibacteraceae bacterium]